MGVEDAERYVPDLLGRDEGWTEVDKEERKQHGTSHRNAQGQR
jgi:hypothetical protein